MTLRKDAMEILRVFNNNVVLAKGGDGGEVILTGRGLGFQAKPGQTVDESKVVRTFVPSDGRDTAPLRMFPPSSRNASLPTQR